MSTVVKESGYALTYLSLGAGRQSSALYLMTTLGLRKCPRATVAIFADTQDEPGWVYENLDRLEAWGGVNGGPPILRVGIGKLSDHLRELQAGSRSRIANVPAFTEGDDGRESMLRRQCTREYKIEPINQAVRWLMGAKWSRPVVGRARCLIGISCDEASRMKPNRNGWIDTAWPLIDAGMRLRDCEKLMAEYGLPVPKKSSCVFCPYHSDAFWRDLRRESPGEFEAAALVDDTIRNMSKGGVKRPLYLHRSLTPLREIDFDNRNQGALFDEECAGVCGV